MGGRPLPSPAACNATGSTPSASSRGGAQANSRGATGASGASSPPMQWGRTTWRVESRGETKSVSCETTFESDTGDIAALGGGPRRALRARRPPAGPRRAGGAMRGPQAQDGGFPVEDALGNAGDRDPKRRDYRPPPVGGCCAGRRTERLTACSASAFRSSIRRVTPRRWTCLKSAPRGREELDLRELPAHGEVAVIEEQPGRHTVSTRRKLTSKSGAASPESSGNTPSTPAGAQFSHVMEDSAGRRRAPAAATPWGSRDR